MKVRCELWVRLKVVDLVSQTAWITLTEKLQYGGVLKGLNHYLYWGMDVEGSGVEDVARELDRVVQMDSTFTNQNKHLYRLLAMEGERYEGLCGRAREGTCSIASFSGEKSGVFSLGTLPIERDYPKLVKGEGDAHPLGEGQALSGNGNVSSERAGGKGSAPYKGKEHPEDAAGASGGTKRNIYTFDCLIRPLLREREIPFMERLNGRLGKARVTDIVAGEVWRITLVADDMESARESIDGMVVTRSRREGLLLNPHYQRYEVISVVGG